MRRVAIPLLVLACFAGSAGAQTPTPVPVEEGSGSEPEPQPYSEPVNDPPEPPPVQIEKKAEVTPVEGPQEIREIIVEDNTKTTSATVEFISGLKVGDIWDPNKIDVIKSRLVSSGLFKDVEVYWTKTDGGVAVHLLAKDKHSWVIAPAFYNQPTNVGGGIGFGENNLFGQNQKLLLYGQIATGDSFFVAAWVIPSIASTRFSMQIDTYIKSARNIEYKTPQSYEVSGDMDVIPVRESRIHYYNFGLKGGLEFWRGINLATRIRGAWVAFPDVKLITEEGATINDVGAGLDPLLAPPPPGDNGWDLSNEWSLTIDKRANWYGIQDGFKYQYSFEYSIPKLSTFNYWMTYLSGMKAWKILERHNLVTKQIVSFGHNLPFQQEFQTGGTSMRGWLNNQFRGNLRWIGNIEYSVPVFTIKGFSVRALAFWDSAYTTFTETHGQNLDGTPSADGSGYDPVAHRHYLPNPQVRGFDGFKNSVGIGTRFYLRQIVLPLLGLDFGYGLEARDFQIYLAIGLTD